MTRTFSQAKLTVLCALLSLLVALPAQALDKRLKLMFKTAAYGAGAGALIGGATAAMGIGSAQNILMGASSGMYAGILLAAYIVATPPDQDDDTLNPYAPKKPTNSSDWKDGEWDEDEYKKSEPKYSPPDSSQRDEAPKGPPQLMVWVPLVTVKF